MHFCKNGKLYLLKTRHIVFFSSYLCFSVDLYIYDNNIKWIAKRILRLHLPNNKHIYRNSVPITSRGHTAYQSNLSTDHAGELR